MKYKLFLAFISLSLAICLSHFTLAQGGPPAPSFGEPGATIGGDAGKSAVEMKKLLVGNWVLENDVKQTITFTASNATVKIKELSNKPTTYKLYDKCPCNFEGIPPFPDLVGCFTTASPKVCYAITHLSKDRLEFRAIDPLIGEYYVLKRK